MTRRIRPTSRPGCGRPVSQPQDKNDIAHAFAAAYDHDGDLIVYFGLDRYASNGDAQVGFWFVKGAVGLTGGPANGGFTGQHTIGDILVQIDFENGGANPSPAGLRVGRQRRRHRRHARTSSPPAARARRPSAATPAARSRHRPDRPGLAVRRQGHRRRRQQHPGRRDGRGRHQPDRRSASTRAASRRSSRRPARRSRRPRPCPTSRSAASRSAPPPDASRPRSAPRRSTSASPSRTSRR